MKRLGERIKRRRENLRMQLNELASTVGVSASALSQIEKAKAFPSIVTLKAIADGLHTTVGELIGENEALSKNPLVRFNEKSFVKENISGCSSYSLSKFGANKQMDTLLLKLETGADTKSIVKSQPGQSFLFVLQGEVNIELDEKQYLLKEKDSFYLNSNRPHSIENKSNADCLIIFVTTPPTR